MNKEKKPLPAHIKLGLQIVGGVVLIGLVFLGGVYVGYDNRSSFQKITDLVHSSDSSVSTAYFSEFWSRQGKQPG
jgi:hypothetical protein